MIVTKASLSIIGLLRSAICGPFCQAAPSPSMAVHMTRDYRLRVLGCRPKADNLTPE